MRLPKVATFAPSTEDPGMRVEELDLTACRDQVPFKASRFVIEPGCSNAPDVHEVHECWFIAQGAGVLFYRGEESGAVRAGDVLRFDPQCEHWLKNSGESALVAFSVWWR